MSDCQSDNGSIVTENRQFTLAAALKKKQQIAKAKESTARVDVNSEELYFLDLAAEKGSSCWLNALPIKRYHFNLTKSEIRDGIALR